jgi:hypothetical protein
MFVYLVFLLILFLANTYDNEGKHRHLRRFKKAYLKHTQKKRKNIAVGALILMLRMSIPSH